MLVMNVEKIEKSLKKTSKEQKTKSHEIVSAIFLLILHLDCIVKSFHIRRLITIVY